MPTNLSTQDPSIDDINDEDSINNEKAGGLITEDEEGINNAGLTTGGGEFDPNNAGREEVEGSEFSTVPDRNPTATTAAAENSTTFQFADTTTTLGPTATTFQSPESEVFQNNEAKASTDASDFSSTIKPAFLSTDPSADSSTDIYTSTDTSAFSPTTTPSVEISTASPTTTLLGGGDPSSLSTSKETVTGVTAEDGTKAATDLDSTTTTMMIDLNKSVDASEEDAPTTTNKSASEKTGGDTTSEDDDSAQKEADHNGLQGGDNPAQDDEISDNEDRTIAGNDEFAASTTTAQPGFESKYSEIPLGKPLIAHSLLFLHCRYTSSYRVLVRPRKLIYAVHE